MFECLNRPKVETADGAPQEGKASATGKAIAWPGAGRVAWSPRDVVSLTRTGFIGNPIGFRAVKIIAEAAAALPVVLQDQELLRGQAGTSGMIQDAWPAGSFVVVMKGRPEQITVPSASRGLDRHYRYGPAKQAVSSPALNTRSMRFRGTGIGPIRSSICANRVSGRHIIFSGCGQRALMGICGWQRKYHWAKCPRPFKSPSAKMEPLCGKRRLQTRYGPMRSLTSKVTL